MALPRFFVPRPGAVAETNAGNPVAQAIDTFVIDRGEAATEEWVVGIDDLGSLSAQATEPVDHLLPYARSALAAREVSRGPARILAAEGLHLFEVWGSDRTADVPGVDDPVQLYGSLLGPLPPTRSPQPPVRTEGQLTVSRGDILHGLVAAADDAFLHLDATTERSTRTMHMLLPGGRLEQLAQGRDLVLAYPTLGARAEAVGPGNEILVTQLLYDLLSEIWTEAPPDARPPPWSDRGALPVPNRAQLERALESAGFTIDRERGRARRGGRLFSLLGGERRQLPPQGVIEDFLRLATEALTCFPEWPLPRTLALAARVRRATRELPPAPAPRPTAATPAAAPPPASSVVQRMSESIDALLGKYTEEDDAHREDTLALQQLIRETVAHPPPVPFAATYPFADLRVEGCAVRAQLVDGLWGPVDVSLYLDGSRARAAAYQPRQSLAQSLGDDGWDDRPIRGPSEVLSPIDETVRWMAPILAGKATGQTLRVAYWSCGVGGFAVQPLDDLDSATVVRRHFPGPEKRGSSSRLAPALRDFANYLHLRPEPSRGGCALFLTDGPIEDEEDAVHLSLELAHAVRDGGLPPLSLVLATLSPKGARAAKKLAERLNASGLRPLWRSLSAEDARVVPQLLAAAVEQATPAATGGTILDDNAVLLRSYGQLPPVLEFTVPAGTRAFVLVTNGKRYRRLLQ